MTDPSPRTASLNDLPPEWHGAVVAIGNFDGVHRGHQGVLQAARAEADHLGVPALMLTLEPHPRAFFIGKPIFRLTPPPLKSVLAAACGMDGTLVLDFDAALAGKSAEEFVAEILVGRLGIRHASTGYDFHFGHKRRGTPEFLRDAGAASGFGVTVVGELSDGGAAVSSTRIRDALGRGDLRSANDLLGWTWSVAGTVQGGDKRGRELGYPTANMGMDPSCGLALGIYAVRYARPDGSVHDGVASYGRRPTFDDGPPLLETFLFDFSSDLYGEAGLVTMIARLRGEERFDSVSALVTQMDSDSIEARAILERTQQLPMDGRVARAFAALGSSGPAHAARLPMGQGLG